MREHFNRIVDRIIRGLGTPTALAIAALTIIVWAITGPLFHFSDTWQLAINTGTTIVTFLMVFVIQNAQNRDAKAVHIKLDELITAIDGARNKLVMAELQTEEEQDREIERLTRVARRAAKQPTPETIADLADASDKAARTTGKAHATKRARAAVTKHKPPSAAASSAPRPRAVPKSAA